MTEPLKIDNVFYVFVPQLNSIKMSTPGERGCEMSAVLFDLSLALHGNVFLKTAQISWRSNFTDCGIRRDIILKYFYLFF